MAETQRLDAFQSGADDSVVKPFSAPELLARVLLKEVWGPDRDDSGSLRVYIGTLCCKPEVDPSRPKHFLTELGLGYRLMLDQQHRNEEAANL